MNPNGTMEIPVVNDVSESQSELAAEVVRLKAENERLRQHLQKVECDGDDGPIEWDEKSLAIFADMRWADRQQLLGNFAEYGDQYVGVFEQQVVGHNESLVQLRIDVERERGIGPDRLATTYVFGPKGIGTRPVWRGFTS